MSILELILLGIVLLLIVYYVFNNREVIKLIRNNHSTMSSFRNVNSNTLLNKYMFKNDNKMNKSSKKKIFIHIPTERNERNWSNFGSRSSTDMNMDIAMLCIESTIRYLENDADIILYSNNNVKDIIQESNTEDLCNLNNTASISGKDLKQWESYCKAKILQKYGGIVIEPCFFFINKPSNDILFPSSLTINNEPNEGLNVSEKKWIPTTCNWISAPKKDQNLELYIKYMNYMCVHRYTEDTKYFDKTFEKLYSLNSIQPKKMGCMDLNGNPVYTADLISNKNIEFENSMFCLFINLSHMKKYRKNEWFLKLDKEEIMKSNTFIGKFIKEYS